MNILEGIDPQMKLNLRFRIFFNFIYLCSLHVSDFMVLSRRLIMVRVFSASCLYRGDCFDRGVILFNSRICICECPAGVNYQMPMVFMYKQECSESKEQTFSNPTRLLLYKTVSVLLCHFSI